MAPSSPSRWSPRLVRRYLLVAAAIVVIALATCTPALADEAPGFVALPERAPSPRPPPGHHTNWYGWELLLADGVSFIGMPTLALATSSNGETSASLLVLGAGGYFFAPGALHLSHGRAGAAAGSLALRIGLPVVGILGGTVATGGCTRSLCGIALAIGAVVGVVSAVGIDAAALAYERVDDDDLDDARSDREAPATRSARRHAARKPIALAPTFGPRREGGFDVGVAGAF